MEPNPDKVELDVDGMADPNHDITYIGKATKMEDGTWRCLANVEGALCLVEVNIKPSKEDLRASVFCCSFCGRSGKDCEVLVAGPMVNICDECVITCVDIVEEQKGKPKPAPVSFAGHVRTEAPCETCVYCLPPPSPFRSIAPWWRGTCAKGLVLKPEVPPRPCQLHESRPRFVPPPGEFSGCRCVHCPEREGTGECFCCAERRDEERNPDPEPFV